MGWDNILRSPKYRNMIKVCMREVNCVQNQSHLLRTVSPVISIVVVPVVAYIPPPNKSDDDGGDGDLLHVASGGRRDDIFQDTLYILDLGGGGVMLRHFR